MKIFQGPSNKIAIQSSQIIFTYSDLEIISKSLADIFSPKCIYGLAACNDASTILIYLALLYNNCTFLIFDPLILRNKNNFIHKIGCNKIISSQDQKELDENEYLLEKIIDGKLQLTLYKKKFDNKLIRDHSPSILLNTSGSSGTPKVVRISYKNLLSNTKAIINSLSLTERDKSISTLPLFYTFGLSIINMHMFTGGTFFASDKSILQKAFEEEMSFFKPTIFSGVPSTYQILKKIDYLHIRQPFIKKITQAGGALDLKTQYEILEICSSIKDFYVMYGQTEATARIACFNLKNFPQKIGSVGLPLNNLSIQIKTHNSDSKIGRICVKGPSITSGYISTFADLLVEPINRTLDTGDLGYLDEDGFLYITGRASRFCKINGKRYNLDVIEKDYNSVNLNKIYAVSNDNVLFLFSTVLIPKKSLKNLGIHPSLIKVISINTIPLKANGKIDYTNLLELVEKNK